MNRISIALAVCASLASAADLTGKWQVDLHAESSAGQTFRASPLCTFTQSGSTLSGTCKGPRSEGQASGSVNGAQVEFTWKTGGGEWSFKGKLDDDNTITGTGAAPQGAASGNFRAVRQKSSEPPPAPDAAPSVFDAAARSEVARKFARLLLDEYAYADAGKKMSDAILARLDAGAYSAIESPQEFANALQNDARQVTHDLHLRVGFNAHPMQQMRQRGPSPDTARLNGGISEVRILDGNIGYIAVDIQVYQDDAARAAIDSAFAFVRNTGALILDLRGNPGGNGGAELFLSYLSEGAPFLAGAVHWRKDGRVQEFRTTDLGARSYGSHKPVFVLISHTTFSAAESLAYEIQSFKRGVIVGEASGGGANPSAGGAMAPLGHGFVANVPTGYVVSPVTGGNWEGAGVKPDVETPAAGALGKAWSLAAAHLASGASDPRTRGICDLLASATLDGEPSLTAAQIAGTYGAPPGRQITIVQRNGKLYLDAPTQLELVPSGGDRYRPAMFSEAFALTFAASNRQVELLRSDPRGAMILKKQ